MSYPFPLPSPAPLPLGAFLSCDSHPSLPLAATSARNALRQSLKTYKALPLGSPTQSSALQQILDTADSYLPYLLAIDDGLSGKQVNGEEVVVTLNKELEVEWRGALAISRPGRKPVRVKGRGLDYEMLFVLVTTGFAHCLEARRAAATYYSPASSGVDTERRKASINAASNSLLAAQSVFAKAQAIAEGIPDVIPKGAVDIQPATLAALSSLCLASATILVVVKDDDYLLNAARSRDETDKEWMYKGQDIPNTRANLLLRFCIASSDHAAKAVAMLQTMTGSIREDLIKYAQNLRITARARACRFLGVDAEKAGRLGEALGYINAGKRLLGLPILDTASAGTKKFKPSLTQMKKDWAERKERKGVDGKTAPTSDDSRKIEEGRVLVMLEKSWSRDNDTWKHDRVVDDAELGQNLPTGREIHKPRAWVQPNLEPGVLEGLRAPPNGDEDEGASDASDDEVQGEQMPGGYPAASGSADTGYY